MEYQYVLFCGSIHWPCLSTIHLNWLIQIAYQVVSLQYMWSSRWTEINSYQWKYPTFDLKYVLSHGLLYKRIVSNFWCFQKIRQFDGILRAMDFFPRDFLVQWNCTQNSLGMKTIARQIQLISRIFSKIQFFCLQFDEIFEKLPQNFINDADLWVNLNPKISLYSKPWDNISATWALGVQWNCIPWVNGQWV